MASAQVVASKPGRFAKAGARLDKAEAKLNSQLHHLEDTMLHEFEHAKDHIVSDAPARPPVLAGPVFPSAHQPLML